MAEIGQYLSRYYADEVINSRGQAIGQEWQPLSPKYKLWKAKHYPGGPEVRTSLMRNSFTFDAREQGLQVGNTQPYFKYQELGTSRIPARRMMGFNTLVKNHIADIIRANIQKKIDSL